MHWSNTYYASTAPHYSRIGERRADVETEKLEQKTPKNSPLRKETPWCSTSSIYLSERSK